MKYALIALMIGFIGMANATERHVTNVNNVTNVTNVQTAPNSLGMAMSGIDFDSNVTSTQIGIGGALYEDQYGGKASSLAIGVGKRVCNTEPDCALIKFTGGINEGGGHGASFGVMWKL
jgi:hypothetical protein